MDQAGFQEEGDDPADCGSYWSMPATNDPGHATDLAIAHCPPSGYVLPPGDSLPLSPAHTLAASLLLSSVDHVDPPGYRPPPATRPPLSPAHTDSGQPLGASLLLSSVDLGWMGCMQELH